MSYYFSKTLDIPFDEAVEKTTAVLKEHGFGVLSDIDIKSTLKEKLNVDFKKYRILGACNPPLAHKALTAESNIGLMLPCNVIVRETENGQVEIAAVDPIASMQAVENEQLSDVANNVQQLLKQVIEDLN